MILLCFVEIIYFFNNLFLILQTNIFRAVRQVLIFVNPYCFVHVQLALQEEKLRLEEEALYAAQREAARAAKQRKLLEVRGKDPNIY